MPVAECGIRELWDRAVRRSRYALPEHLWFSSSRHLAAVGGGGSILLPLVYASEAAAKIAYSMPRMSGGPAPVRSLEDLDLLKEVLEYLESAGFDLFAFTFKAHWNAGVARKLAEVLGEAKPGSLAVPMYARVLDLDTGWQILWKSMSKKARNLARKFARSGGRVVAVGKPLSLLDEIMSVNLSGVFRQGRPLPRGYTDIRAVASRLAELSQYPEFTFYGAFVNDKLAGYAYVLSLNGYAYVSRFLTHRSYFRIGVSEGLLAGVLEDMCRRGVKRVQYAYWSPLSHPGIDHFLKQFGFRRGAEYTVYVPFTARGALVAKAKLLRGRARLAGRGALLLSPARRLSELLSYALS